MPRNTSERRGARPAARTRRGRRGASARAVPKVALLIETSNAYARGLMRGIVGYMREHRPWSIYLSEHTRGDRPPIWLTDWDGDGVIARIETKAIARAIEGLSLPVVDVSAARLIPTLPWVETDDPAVAHLAAEHLMERGFRNFGFCGDDRFNWSKWRCDRFRRLVCDAGHSCSVYPQLRRQAADSQLQFENIAQWVAGLPKPLAVMACYDFRGQQVLDACRRRGITVPDEVAVLGVDNDDLLCDLTAPPLSSVILNPYRTGYEAATLLERMMSGERVGADKHAIEPLGIAVRQSTDVLAIEDPHMAAVVRYIREHACEGIDVGDALKAHPQSRRLLEYRFQKLLGRTPHEEIMRVRLNRVKLLLTESALPLKRIAQIAGFPHSEYLSAVFRQKVGMPPGEYRRLSHGGRPAPAKAAGR